MNYKNSVTDATAGGLRVLGYREYQRYYNKTDLCPLDMIWTESGLGIPVEVKINSLEHALLNIEKSEAYYSEEVRWPISALCLVSEALFVSESYREFTEVVTRNPDVEDYLSFPKVMTRIPEALWTAQATIRYLRAAQAARAALKEIETS